MVKVNGLVGTDPEMFATDVSLNCIPPFILRKEYGLKVLDGEVDAETGFIKHSVFVYGNPVTINNKIVPAFTIMEDGSAFEIPVSPSDSSKVLYNRFVEAKEILCNILDKYNLNLYTKPCIDYNPTKFPKWKDTEDYKFANRFGCDKDFNIYSGQYSKEIDASSVYYRFAGGHVHFSSNVFNLHLIHAPATKLFDICVGNLYIANTPYINEERKRQQYYGTPGTIRFPVYPDNTLGLEYRTPSVSLWSSEENVEKLFLAINYIVRTLEKPAQTISIINEYLQPSIENIVNFNQENAVAILENLKILE